MFVAVTGASGYIAGHIVKQLLENGHRVRGVVRDLSNKSKYDYLEKFANLENQLEFVQVNDQNYENAFVGVDAVIHTATPYIYTAKDPQKEIVEPAVNLTRGVIEAALKNQVKRVVITSSGGAIFSFPVPQGKIFTSNDWNLQSNLTNNPYFYSKRLAEEEAWRLYKENSDKIEIVVVNPVYVLGPTLNPFINTSVENLKKYLLGEHETVQVGGIAIVDVRNVATAHVLAVEKKEAAGKRLICSGQVCNWSDIPKTLKQQFPQYAVSKYTEFPEATTYGMDTQPLKDLGLVEYYSFEQTIRDTVESLLEHNLIEKL
ncbi:predicted protein [Naegleria gruberi]|uniref:Predicted protein n=1 Tax=Naegleria gruberi TaxID=5762 RepID=D2V043_NAEGR|nr:uncharacterized protein NAEGRDRAFT_45618 [Naegleria gruberi]EFC49465.1 predicted protein [Naegleria gruberi]|eukprot:XP_002682209.1 predicted protein [Naegleria gruberi strain NEG-M]